LFQRYGSIEDAPKAPELPNWCFEEEEGASDDDGIDDGESQQTKNNDPNRPQKKMKRRPYNEVDFNLYLFYPGHFFIGKTDLGLRLRFLGTSLVSTMSDSR